MFFVVFIEDIFEQCLKIGRDWTPAVFEFRPRDRLSELMGDTLTWDKLSMYKSKNCRCGWNLVVWRYLHKCIFFSISR